MVSITISYGEFLDRRSILILKTVRCLEPQKREAARDQLRILEQAVDWGGLWGKGRWGDVLELAHELENVNSELWGVEDDIRRLLSIPNWDMATRDAFQELAKSVPKLNDQRAELKSRIDRKLGVTGLSEVKSYVV